MIEEIKNYISHDDLCEFLQVDRKKGLANLEIIYRPDAGMWLIIGKSFDKDDEINF